MTPLGAIAMDLPWLSPCAASLVALARAPTRVVWSAVRGDPGGVLLLVRHSLSTRSTTGMSVFASALTDPAVLEAALDHLAHAERGFVDWARPECAPVFQSSQIYARLAQLLAQRCDCCDPDHAWVGGLLAPLGRMALAACDASEFENRRNKIEPSAILTSPQILSSLDAHAVARRINCRWNLPPWLAAITGHLGLPLRIAQALGADPSLFQVVQLAVALAQEKGHGLALPVGASTSELAGVFGLSHSDLDVAWQAVACQQETMLPVVWEAPMRQPLLPELLRAALENRRLEKAALTEQLQHDLDALHRAVAEQQQGEAIRLERLKLEALAELAAGAGHEINNPLAVISGQAQYLLGHELDPSRRRALQTIVNQANRIHQALTDLMQFARPLPPRKQPVEVSRLLREVSLSLQGLAADRHVRLTSNEPPATYHLQGDPAQIQTALTCLVRNAIEAAPAEGWADVHVQSPNSDQLEFVVEDNGQGLSEADREHLFDPFYSGRKAGRGRGLGLSTAWRLAQQHGGEVHYERPGDGPTRFILRLPGATVFAPHTPVDSTANGANGCHLSATTDA